MTRLTASERPAHVKALYFACFGLIGGYAPYLSLYYAAVGLSIAQIGVLSAVPQLTRIVGPAFWGWLSDRSRRRSALLRLSAGLATALAVAIALAGGNYVVLVGVVALFSFSTAAQVPIAESMALRVTGGDAGRYGRLRLWGSVGFTLAMMGAGPLLDAAGVRYLPWLMAALAAFLFAVTWRVPESPPPAHRTSEPAWRRLRDPVVALFFVANFLMLFAHAPLYGFYSLFLDGFGWSKSAIGIAWTIGVVAEIVIFRVQHRIFSRFPAIGLLGFSMVVAALRFLGVAWGGGSIVAVVLTQLLHAVTFGVHHSAVMALIHRWFAPDQHGRAQALYSALGYGVAGSSGGLAASWLWEHAGPSAAFIGAAVAASTGALLVALCARIEYARAGSRLAAADGSGSAVR